MTKQPDHIESLDGALIQHGPLSQRVYIMKLDQADPHSLISSIDHLAQAKGYTKAFAKIPATKAEIFLTHGYRIEATIPKLYQGMDDGLFLGKFYAPTRQEDSRADVYDEVTRLAQERSHIVTSCDHVKGRWCTLDDAEGMAALYAQVFPSYPFPIHDPVYLRDTMTSHVCYSGIEYDGHLVALASGEMEFDGKNVEMTDFATLPEHRGQGYAQHLLAFMETELLTLNLTTAYTIARAGSSGMNITFARAGYQYAGRLINNTHIAGHIESMNVWYKDITGIASID